MDSTLKSWPAAIVVIRLNLQFFLRSKKLREITEKLITEVHRVSKHYDKNCNYSPTFEDFSVLCQDNNKCFLQLKESLLLMRNWPSMNRNVFHPFLPVWMRLSHIVCCILWTSAISFLVSLHTFLDLKKNCKF